MNAEWLLHTFYAMEEVLEDSDERFSFIERDEGKPTELMRLTAIEKQMPYRSYVFAQTPNMERGIDMFFYKDSRWRYLGLSYQEEEEVIAFYQGMMTDDGIKFFDVSKNRAVKQLRDLLYDYFVQHPSYRLKEATGVIRDNEPTRLVVFF